MLNKPNFKYSLYMYRIFMKRRIKHPYLHHNFLQNLNVLLSQKQRQSVITLMSVLLAVIKIGIISISRYRDIDRQPRQATISYSKPCQRYRVNVHHRHLAERLYVVITGINQHTVCNTSRRPRTAGSRFTQSLG